MCLSRCGQSVHSSPSTAVTTEVCSAAGWRHTEDLACSAESRSQWRSADLNSVSSGSLQQSFANTSMFFDLSVPSCVGRGKRSSFPTQHEITSATTHDERRFYGQLSHSGRLTYEDDSKIDNHHRQNAISQLLLDTALVWTDDNANVYALKAQLKQIDRQAFCFRTSQRIPVRIAH